ncbi:MAG: hypothetical protein E6R03_07295 [Hyphomicrobiaceae bacterium]|nr:MAG: hypothetical protein E6R03_07295 [Hyphomicrobiaceae bacterium]
MASEDSAGAARMARYQENHRDELRTIAATGTLVQDSLAEMFNLFSWTLKERAPIPYEWTEQQLWCAAMDPTEGRRGRSSPEYLIRAFGGDVRAEDPHAELRRAFGRRLRTTPGFIVVNKSSCATPVHIRVVPAPRDATIEQGMIEFRVKGKAADGYILGDTLSKASYEEAFGCGYYDRWDPRPPFEWLEKRNAYNEAVADAIKRSPVPIETERQARRLLKDSRELREWLEVSTGPDAFVPNPVPVAVSLSVVNWIAEWLKINSPAIVWVDGTWLGETLEVVSGVPYYSKDGKSRARRAPQPGESIIASLKSNYRGRNWWRWSRNLVVPALASNKWHEQVIGRTHRQLQKDPVFVDYLVTSHLSLRAFEKAQDRARGTKDFFELTQKIISTDWDWSAVPRQILDPVGCGVTDQGFLARWYPKGMAIDDDVFGSDPDSDFG